MPSTLHVGSGETYLHIQNAVTAAKPGDTILVDPGTYQEQVIIPAGANGIKLKSLKPLAAVIQAPPSMASPKAIVEVAGAQHVTIDGFTITGPGGGPSDSLEYGIRVDGGGSATITHNHITHIQDSPLGSSGTGVGIDIGRALMSDMQTGSAEIEYNLIDNYQKGGIVVDNSGSRAEIEDNTIVGVGATAVIAQNGIQISNGASAEVSGNQISGNIYTPPTQPQSVVATGIVLSQPGAVTVDHNTVSGNDAGIYALNAKGVVIAYNRVSDSTFDGITLNGTTGAKVSHNEVRNSGGDGIVLINTSTNNRIDDNRSVNNGNDGIFVDLGSTNNRITDNYLKGNTNLDAEDLSTGLGTALTANFWNKNKLKTASPAGLLTAQKGHHGDGGDDNGDDD